MDIINYFKLAVLLGVCVYSSYSDTRYNLIKNKWLAIAFFAGLAFDIPEAIIFDSGVIFRLFNIAVINLISIALYLLHIWAGADCKLIAVISLLVPYDYYLKLINNYFCLSFILVFAFTFSYIALIADSIRIRIKTKTAISKSKLLRALIKFIYKYFIIMSYITFVDLILIQFIKDSRLSLYLIIIVNIGILLIVSMFKLFQKPFAFLPVFVAGIILKLIFNTPILTKKLIAVYAVVLLMSALRILIQQYNYEVIPSKDIKKGMVLSLQTTLLFADSTVKGLPKVSKENLNDRITEEEAKSVIRWSKTSAGSETVTIVRKMPFAVFISIGTVVFIVFGALL